MSNSFFKDHVVKDCVTVWLFIPTRAEDLPHRRGRNIIVLGTRFKSTVFFFLNLFFPFLRGNSSKVI